MNLQTYPVATLVTHSEEITAAGRSVAGGFLPNKCLGSKPVLEHVDELLEDVAAPCPQWVYRKPIRSRGQGLV